jgi:uncharacterized membrane protein
MKLSDWRDDLICDKKDPRLLIPRPYPRVGWTFNFGHPLTWIFIIVLLLIIVGSMLFLK